MPTSTLEKIAPKIAVPNEPPIERKNVAPEVATPSSLCGTPFCTMITSTCMTPPRPMPSTSMHSASKAVDDEGVIRDSRNRPMVISAVPAIGKKRYLPVRAMTWPEVIETSSSPAISGSRYTPEMVGEMPRTTWKNAGR